jgi:uncharacterized surface protein with fasciclin (FAS1) repeats
MQIKQIAASMLTLATLSVAQSALAASKDIVDTAVSAGKFKTLVKAIGAAGLADTLKGPGPFTVFAPDDEAFAKIPSADLTALLADKDKLTKVLTFHVVKGNLPAKTVVAEKTVTTLEGESLPISKEDGKVKIGNADITGTDIKCTNGVIHVIDNVLMPQ